MKIFAPSVAWVLGDSLSAGFTTNLRHSWTSLLNAHPLISPYITIANSAKSGDTIQGMQARYDASIKGQGGRGLVFTGGVNNFNVLNEDGPTAWGRAESLINEALADGLRVLAIGFGGWSGYSGWTSGKQIAYAYFHEQMFAKIAPGYSILDLSSDLSDPNDPEAINPVVSWGDGLHIGDLGQPIIANRAAVAVKAMNIFPRGF